MSAHSFLDVLQQTVQSQPPAWAIVLGSGLGEIVERVAVNFDRPFAEVPGLSAGEVEGHAGRLVLGSWAGQRVLVFAGRVHAYEGRLRDEVTAGVRLAASLGTRRIVFTNAAGGIRDDLAPGTLTAAWQVCDACGAWFGEHLASPAPLGTSPALSARLQQVAEQQGVHVPTGIYAAVLGPNYETPAEIRALRAIGVDAVGMSTAWELRAAIELGMECVVLSCITNRAAGLTDQRLTHAEVLANSQRQARRMGDLIEGLILLASGGA